MRPRPSSCRRRYRAAEQFHLAQEMDLEPRRRAGRDRRARHVRGDSASQGHADLPHRRASRRAWAMTAATTCSIRPRASGCCGRVSPEISASRAAASPMPGSRSTRSAYRPVSDGVVAAGRVRLGTILGAERDDIAPSRRFYSGGGGSVRGYGYQQLGPRDVDGDPIGGRGLAEFALEARVRLKAFGGNFGIVPFLDGGTLSTDAMPDFKDWRFGAGIGARYYSSFGPIRIDVGTPLNRAAGRRPGRGRSSRSGRPSRWPKTRSPATGASAAASAAAATGRGGCSTSCWRCCWRCWSCSPAALVLLDTAPGHRFIVDRIGQIETAIGPRIRIGRIDGSIFGKSQAARTSRSPTRSGVFLTSPGDQARLGAGRLALQYAAHRPADGRPGDARSACRSSGRPAARGRSCPSSTSTSASSTIDRLELGAGGHRRRRAAGGLRGKADIRAGPGDGRAPACAMRRRRPARGQARRRARPRPLRPRRARDRRRRNGLLPALVGHQAADRPDRSSGDGSWSRWRGRGGARPVGPADGAAGARRRQRPLPPAGRAGAGAIPQGQAAAADRAGGPRCAATRRSRIGVLDGAAGAGLAVAAGGGARRGRPRPATAIARLRLGVDLLRPPALFPNMTGRNVRHGVDARRAVRTRRLCLSADLARGSKFDNTGFVDVRAEGRGPAVAVADARAAAAAGAGDHRGRRRRRRDPRQCPARGHADGHPASSSAATGSQLTSAKLNGKVSLLIDLVTGRFEIVISGGMTRYLIPGLGIVDVETELQGRARARAARARGSSARRKAWVRRLDNSFFARPDRRPAADRDRPRARQRRHRPLHQPAALFAQAAAVGAGHPQPRRHLPHRGARPAGEIRHAADDRSTGGSSGRGSSCSSTGPNEALGIRDMRLLLDPDRRPASTIAPAAGRGSGRSPATAGSCCRKGGRTMIAIAALERRRDARRAATCAPIRAASPARWRWPAAASTATLDFAPVGGAQRIEAHLARQRCRASPARSRSAAGGSTGPSSSPRGGPRSTAWSTRAGFEPSGITLARLTANARLVNGSGQVRAAIAGRRGAAFELHDAGQRHARPDQPDRARRRSSGGRWCCDRPRC